MTPEQERAISEYLLGMMQLDNRLQEHMRLCDLSPAVCLICKLCQEMIESKAATQATAGVKA